MDTTVKTVKIDEQYKKLEQKYQKVKLANENQHNVIFLLYEKLKD